jgi:hypothetical protein
MFTSDYGFQHINWWHDPIAGELFKHKGTLSTHLINMRLTLGINDWWDISFEPSLVKRCMDWYVEEESVHHRTECSSVDYRNEHGNLQAKGGYLGDFQIKTRYLFKNTGKGFGSRIFFESGLIVPSGNVLVADPYFLDHDPDIGEEDHRHFSVSDGVYKGVFGFEYSMKRLSYPVFWGIFSNIQYPLKENKYEFLASKNYSLTFIALSGPPNLKGKDQFKLVSIGFGLSVRHSSYSKWHGINSPNSKSTAITPSLSFVIASKDYGTFGINLNMSDVDSFNAGDASPGNNFKQKASVVGFSLSYRKTLDKVIKKLYWK